MKRITVHQPCPIKETTMPQTERGFYCTNCSREVIDFTEEGEDAIIHTVNQQKGRVCGKFHATQLFLAKALLVPALVGSLSLGACHPKYSEQEINIESMVQNNESEVKIVKDIVPKLSVFTIKGVVKLKESTTYKNASGVDIRIFNEHSIAMRGAAIMPDGTFELIANTQVYSNENFKLRFSYVGYKPVEVDLRKVINKELEIVLEVSDPVPPTIIIGEVLIPKNDSPQMG